MKELLQIFQYIQKYHEDNIDVLCLTLEFLLVGQNQALRAEILDCKTREIPQSFYAYLQKHNLIEIEINPKMNCKKILKIAQNLKMSAQELEDFIQTITLQKTILKLYDYATPAEINALVCGLLNLQKDESIYNPCCGVGSWLLSLSAHYHDCQFFGVDVHPKLIGIAKMLTMLLGFKDCRLEVADIFKESSIKKDSKTMQRFDKVFCHPPLLPHLNLKAPKNSPLAPYTKTAPEIPFLDFALMCFEKKAIFIIRSVLLNKSIGERLCHYLVQSRLIEAILELPTNIFPHQMGEFCILVLSPDNRHVFFVNAQEFYLKEGKYNKLINLEEMLDLFASRQNTKISCLLDYQSLDFDNLKPSHYTQSQNNKESKSTKVLLGRLLEKCYRGMRIEAKQDKDLIGCYDLGIKDFEVYGVSNSFDDYVLKPNLARLYELKVQPYDVLLSLRGVTPKVAIIGKCAAQKIVLPNAGILVLRAKNSMVAKALYFYFLSSEGCLALSKIYQNNNERIGEKEIKQMLLPSEFLDFYALENYNECFYELCARGEQIRAQKQGIAKLLGYEA